MIDKIYIFFKIFRNFKSFCIKIPNKMNGTAKPIEYILSKITAILKVYSIATRVNIEPKIGPITGVHPNPNARPIK